MKRSNLMALAAIVLALAWAIGNRAATAYAHVGIDGSPTPAPVSTPTPTPQAKAPVVFDPSGSLKGLATGMMRDTFKDIDGTLEDFLNKVIGWVWKLATTTPDGGLYSTAAKPFSAVGVILFVPMAVLRLVWHQKRLLVGENDTLVNVAFDIIAAAVMVLGVGVLTDWTAEKVYALISVITGKIGIHGMLPQSWQSAGQALGAMASESVGMLLFSGFLLLGGILAFLAFGMAFLAVHGLFYILVALGPIVFTIGMLPPFGWMKRLWWMGFGATVLTPFIGTAALGAFALVLSPNFGGDVLAIKFIIRMVWLWAAAGMMWSLLGVITRFTFAASLQAAGKIVSSATRAIGGLTTAGALAGATGLGGLSNLGTGLATQNTAANVGQAATAGGTAASPAEHLEQAAEHVARAGVFNALSSVPGLGGLRAMAGYHRTLADVHRMQAFAGGKRSGGKPAALPHSAAQSLFSKVGGSGSYDDALNAVQSRLQGIEDPEIGPVMPRMWSEQNDSHASLAARLAVLYQQEPQLFEGVQDNPDRWFEIKTKAYNLPIQKQEKGK